jgi:hypothetical protein
MSKSECPYCCEETYENGVCSDCGFSTIDEDNLKCPHCSDEVTVVRQESGKCEPKCRGCFCIGEMSGFEEVCKETAAETVEAWIELCKNYPSNDVNSVFGFGESTDWDPETEDYSRKEMCVYVSDAHYWEKEGYCSDYTNPAEYEALREIGLGEECDGVFVKFKKREGNVLVDMYLKVNKYPGGEPFMKPVHPITMPNTIMEEVSRFELMEVANE